MRSLICRLATFYLLTTLSFFTLSAQQNIPVPSGQPGGKAQPDSFLEFSGDYGTKDSTLFSIIYREKTLFFSTGHYGKIKMLPLPDNRFQLERVKPEAFISFDRDGSGKVVRLVLRQKGNFNWIKLTDSVSGQANSGRGGQLSAYTGKYRQDIDLYAFITISDSAGHLKSEKGFVLEPEGKDRFRYSSGEYIFSRDRQGRVQKLVISSDGPQFYERRAVAADGKNAGTKEEHISSRHNGFTRSDTLHGMLTAARTCYDVLFYDLNVTVEPETKSIHGNTVIRFRTVRTFDSLQVDLFANMKIERIVYHGRELPYSREYNAVFIHFPASPAVGSVEEINIFYRGQPQLPDIAIMAGGIFWVNDREGGPWIESVCQGSGASLWWPCKDHLSDKPDSMKISVTVPTGLTDISNGRLIRVTPLPDNRTRFEWYVSYPINNYNAVINIGNYTHYTESYGSGADTMTLNFYCMPYNLGIAKKIFGNAKAMLAFYEKIFGPYPFKKDGFTLMESFYGMEHQSAVSIGYLNSPFNSDKYDSAELTRVMWHESSHEWWGNSVTCSDYADFWIHESFATYAEIMAYDHFAGPEAAAKYLRQQVGWTKNNYSIIGAYDVNNFDMGDVYAKGGLMLNTLRHTIDNDSLWFAMLRGIQEHFRYQSVKTKDIEEYICGITRTNYRPFFDQYLRHTAVPQLALELKEGGGDLVVRYKWNTDVAGFDMRIKATSSKDAYAFLYPTNEWKTIRLENMKAGDFKVDRDDFYVEVRRDRE